MQSFDVAGDVPFGDGEVDRFLSRAVRCRVGQHAMFMAQEIRDICKHVGVEVRL